MLTDNLETMRIFV